MPSTSYRPEADHGNNIWQKVLIIKILMQFSLLLPPPYAQIFSTLSAQIPYTPLGRKPVFHTDTRVVNYSFEHPNLGTFFS